MSSSSDLPKSGSGRLTGLVLGLTVFVCISLIGLAGFVKYELDRAETALAAPPALSGTNASEFSAELQAFDKIRDELGYGGFLGVAQNFAASHDPALLLDMRTQLKQAAENLGRLPEKSAAETRHDLQAILATFEAAMQKAEKSAPDFAAADLVPLYAALPILETRVANVLAANRSVGQNQTQFWATLLTIICWSSLIIASALTAGIYLVLRDRNSAPMRALAQSVKNMARGDMRTSIWGMERHDAIGDLARAVDMARFHFSQLPDMSLLSEQGPVRIRFEGNTRSLFEAMMRVISRDSEQVHKQADTLTQAVNKQHEALALVIERVEAVLQNVEKRAVSGDQQVRQALQGMLGSAESLKHAQEHAADQLNRIIPYLQERTQGLSEIAQITGKQVAQALQSLSSTERGLKSSAEQSEAAIRKFSSTADTLGERMFGAINLLQASGKVLAETTETTQSRLDQAIERMGSAGAPAATAAAPLYALSAERLEGAVTALESAHAKLENLLAEQTQVTRAHIDLLTTQSSGLLTQASATSQTLSTAADRLRDEQAKLGALLNTVGAQVESAKGARTTDDAMVVLISSRIDELARQIATQTAREPDLAAPLLTEIKDGIASIAQSITILHGQIAALQADVFRPDAKPIDIGDQMRDHWYQMAAQIEATRANLTQAIAQQTERVEAHIANLAKNPATAAEQEFARDTQHQMEQQTLILNELVATLGLLDAHMQDLRSQVSESTQKAG